MIRAHVPYASPVVLCPRPSLAPQVSISTPPSQAVVHCTGNVEGDAVSCHVVHGGDGYPSTSVVEVEIVNRSQEARDCEVRSY